MDGLCYEGTLPNYSEGEGPGVCETLGVRLLSFAVRRLLY